MNEQFKEIQDRLAVIEKILGINQLTGNTGIKAAIKRGSNDFNNNVHVNPFIDGDPRAEWWKFGYDYAKDLDEQ